MEKSKTLFLGFRKFTCVLIALLLIASIFGLLPSAVTKVSAEDYFTEIPPTQLSLANGHFNTTSSSYPANVNSWSGGYKGNLSGDFVVSGVIELTKAYSSSANEIKLNQYPEYENGAIPQTPFGKSKTENGSLPYFEGSSSSALMINTDKHETVYGFTSPTLSLDAHGFYKIGAWVKTGDFASTSHNAGVGASIALNGIDESTAVKNGFDQGIAFTAINTMEDSKEATADNYYGWQEYVFYIATDYHSYSVTLDLSVGYAFSGKETSVLEPANGYALFDTVTAYSISPEDFESATSVNRERVIIVDCDSSTYLTDANGKDIGSFSSYDGDNHNINGWTQITSLNGEQFSPQTNEAPFIYNPNNFTPDNNIKLEKNPATPFGLSDKGNNILLFYNTELEYKGLSSPAITVKKNSYMKIGFWTNTANLKDDNTSASASLVYVNPNDPENEVINTISSIKGNTENNKNYGWVYNAFFIKASNARDYDIALQLWFGRGDTPAKGVAMFDEIKIETIDAETYNDYSSSFTNVNLSSDYTDNSGVTNGNFVSSENTEDNTYPLNPTGWTASTEDKEDIVAGLLPKDNINIWSDYNITYPFTELLPSENFGNALVISSEKPVNYSFTSSEITVATETTTLITVRLRTENGAKAYISAKNNGTSVAKIISVSSEREFTDYKIYIKNGTVSHSVTLEIALGNASRKSQGAIIVSNVKSESVTEFDYDNIKTRSFYNSGIAVYDYDDVYACDTSEYNSDPLMTSYHWNFKKGDHSKATNDVKYGILYLKDSRKTYLPSDFDKGLAPKDYIFYAQNTAPNASVFTYNKAIDFLANTYYEIKVTAKVEMSESYLKDHPDAVGLGIRLDNTDYAFSNIIQTRTLESDSEFKTYSFYVSVGDQDADSTYLSLTFGGTENINQFAQGKFYVNNISISDITESSYNNAIDNLVEYNEDNKDETEFGMKIEFTQNTTEDDNTPPENNDNDLVDSELNPPDNLYWYILPSVLFGIFLLLAIVAVIIRKLGNKVSNRKRKEKSNTYDRDNTLHIDVNNPETTQKAKKAVDKYESFDEDAPVPEPVNNVPEETHEEEPITQPEEATEEQAQSTEKSDTDETAATTETTAAEEGNPQEPTEKPESHEDFND